MKRIPLYLIVMLGLASVLTGCDPFADEVLPPATVVLQQPLSGANIQLGEPFNIRAIVRTAYDVDSLLLVLFPVESQGQERFTQKIPVPASLISIENNYGEATLNTEITLESLPINGYSEYYLSITPYVKNIQPRGLGSGSHQISFE